MGQTIVTILSACKARHGRRWEWGLRQGGPYHRRMPHLRDVLSSSFFGPLVLAPGQKTTPRAQRGRNFYPTLVHWYESARFMPHRPDLRDLVLHYPTAKEVRKLAKANEAVWRSDWNLVSPRILTLGLCLLALEGSCPGLQTCEAPELSAALEPLGLPQSITDGCVDRFLAWRSGPKIGVYGAHSAPEAIVGRKLASVVSNRPDWTLVSLCNSRTSWRVHDWALSLYLPVRYVGDVNSRMSAGLGRQLVDSVDKLVVFEQRGDRKADAVLQYARAQKKPVALELYTARDASAGSLIS